MTAVAIQGISVITCPACGHAESEEMAVDSCQYFYDCRACGGVIKALPGDCCVYCSYGTVPCPSIQEARAARPSP